MTTRLETAGLAVMPAVFVFLWSTGFIGAKFGMPYADPLTFLTLRFIIVATCLGFVALVWRAPWPRSLAEYGHIAVAGILLQGVYLGGVFVALDLGVEAGVSALIVGIQPLLTAAAVGPFLGERVSRRHWLGLLLGLVGVTLVVWRKLALGIGTPAGMGLSVLALFGITLGTLYQKRFCANLDVRTGSIIQFIAAGAATGLLALLVEDLRIDWTAEFLFALAWLVIVLSFGAITLLFILIRRGAASRVSSLFYLVPPTTALIAWLLFGETFGPTALAGLALVVLGVALINTRLGPGTA